MVWFVNKLTKGFMFAEVTEDTIFQSTNIMLTLANRPYDMFEIYALWNAGVNIFNVDRTKCSEEMLQDIKRSMGSAQNLFHPNYYRPMALSVTMCPRDKVNIDDRVDLVVLKDVSSSEELVDFKKHQRREIMPILLWISKPNNVSLFMNKIANGYIMEVDQIYDEWAPLLQACREDRISKFFIEKGLLESRDVVNERHIVQLASKIVRHRLDGLVLFDGEYGMPTELIIKTLVLSMRYIEGGIIPKNDFLYSSFTTKTPLTAYATVVKAACTAALYSDARAILLLTVSGRSASWVSAFAPPCHILAITNRECTTRRLHLNRRVVPLLYTGPRAPTWTEECHNRVEFGIEFALRLELFGHGAQLVVLAPTLETTGYCNSFHLVTVPHKCDTGKHYNEWV